jgi:hypothetical protein
MPARRRQLLASFRRCLWRFCLRRVYVRWKRRPQRYRVALTLNRDATGLSRGSFIKTGCGLTGIARHLPLTSGDSGRGLINAARLRLLPRSDTGLIGAARHLLLSGNPRGDFVDATTHQLLTGSDPVEA